jgi:hypothetical protein
MSLRRADHSSRGVLLTVARRFVWSRNLVNEEVNSPRWAAKPEREKERSILVYVYKGCVIESDDFKKVINSKRFQLFSFNTYEHNVYIKAFWFLQLTRWKQKSYFLKITSFRWPPFRSRHWASLLGTSPITLWSISTGIPLTSCCFYTTTFRL